MYKHFFKRLIDICIGLVALPFVLLVIVIFAPIIYFTDRGPVFYNAVRIGRNMRGYKMFKLRSMYVNAPDIRNADGSTYNSYNDSRVTPIGRFLRKSSLDEFPQFLNVLLGHMSFIGPRPATPKIFEEEITPIMKRHFDVKPGITGYTQAYYRNAIEKQKRYELDAYYAENVSFVLDVKILIQTIQTVIKSENIYHN